MELPARSGFATPRRHANAVALDDVEAAGLDRDAGTGESGDRQAADGAAAAVDLNGASAAAGHGVQPVDRHAEVAGFVVASMTTGSAIVGGGAGTAIACGPGPGMLKAMVSSCPVQVRVTIACRSEPGPLSFVLRTVSVRAPASPPSSRSRSCRPAPYVLAAVTVAEWHHIDPPAIARAVMVIVAVLPAGCRRADTARRRR